MRDPFTLEILQGLWRFAVGMTGRSLMLLEGRLLKLVDQTVSPSLPYLSIPLSLEVKS